MELSSQLHSTLTEEGKISSLLNIISKLTTYTNKYVMGFVIILGILGNILSIVVFGRCKRRDLVTVTYLTPLAYADLVTLIYGAYTWIVTGVLEQSIGYFFIEPRVSLVPQILCKSIRYVYRTSSCVSSYILVLFSCERCLGVWLPLNVHLIMSSRRRLAAIAITSVLQLILNSPVIVYYSTYYVGGTNNVGCYFYLPNHSKVARYSLIQVLDSVLPHALPCCLILATSFTIVVGLRRAERETAAVTGRKYDRANLISLLLVCLLYIVSTAPYVSVWGYFDYFDHYVGEFLGHTSEEITMLYMVGLFTTSISMMNYSFNFLIYSFTLKIYKDELRTMAKICLRSKRIRCDKRSSLSVHSKK
jgi:hypothetical protein